MTIDRQIALFAGMGSVAALAAALFFEHVLGLAPCPLCLWQRWPHVIAAGVAALAWLWPAPALFFAGALAVASSGALGVYHTGVERGWWAGPQICAGAPDLTRLSAEDLFDRLLAAPIVRCEDVAWQLFGLSMASWNALLSFSLAALWLAALWHGWGKARTA